MAKANGGPSPDLSGAIHLDNPMMEQARKFLADFVVNQGSALIIIGATSGGIAISAQAPGGQIQVLGMLVRAEQIIGGQGQQASPTTPGARILRPQ